MLRARAGDDDADAGDGAGEESGVDTCDRPTGDNSVQSGSDDSAPPIVEAQQSWKTKLRRRNENGGVRYSCSSSDTDSESLSHDGSDLSEAKLNRFRAEGPIPQAASGGSVEQDSLSQTSKS